METYWVPGVNHSALTAGGRLPSSPRFTRLSRSSSAKVASETPNRMIASATTAAPMGRA